MPKLAMIALVVLAAIIVGVGIFFFQRPPTNNPTGLSQTVVDGFTPFASFRASDPPGTVFRISRDRAVLKVIELPVEVHSAPEVTNNIRATRKFSAEQLLHAIADAGNCVPVSASFKPAAMGEVRVSSLSGTREYTFDVELEKQLDALRRMFSEKKITFRKDDEYWLIRETIKTADVDYSSSSGWLAEANAEATLRNCASSPAVEGKVRFNWDSSSGVSLSRRFEQPLRGWYIAERLTVELPFGASPSDNVIPEIALPKASDKSEAKAPDL